MKRNILCMGAHPDDVEIGMGGTVAALAAQGHKVLILDLTDGEPTPKGSPEVRARESKEAAGILQAERITLPLPNRYLENTIENRKVVASEIRKFRPAYIFAPYPEDAHPDHIAAGELAEASRFYAKLTKSDIPGDPFYPQRVIYYFSVHIRLRKEPSFVLDISKYMQQKRDAIECYRSQFEGKEKLLDHLFNENQYWGFQIGSDAGEPFFQKETVGFRNWPDGYK
ncbi:MAG: bacillithiol biosynthesis deacetylase BshB1 [Spirochaetia bacterium]|nr:bacillithiol biosynthesis deacetylase BshB1 [Spirochaetia bacterium]